VTAFTASTRCACYGLDSRRRGPVRDPGASLRRRRTRGADRGLGGVGPVCGKQLRPLVPILVEAMERHGHLRLAQEVRISLLAMSAATIDRALRDVRRHAGGGDAPQGGSFQRGQAQRAGAHV